MSFPTVQTWLQNRSLRAAYMTRAESTGTCWACKQPTNEVWRGYGQYSSGLFLACNRACAHQHLRHLFPYWPGLSA